MSASKGFAFIEDLSHKVTPGSRTGASDSRQQADTGKGHLQQDVGNTTGSTTDGTTTGRWIISTTRVEKEFNDVVLALSFDLNSIVPRVSAKLDIVSILQR